MKAQLLSALLILTPLLVHAESAPAVPIEQALKIAQDYLKEQGLSGAHHISALTLEPTTLARREFRWIAKWSPSVKRDAKTENGLEIQMDGSIARLVTDPNKRKRDVNRPSALDMR